MSDTTIAAVATAAASTRPAEPAAGGASADAGFVAALVAALAGTGDPTTTLASELAAHTGAAPTEDADPEAPLEGTASVGTVLGGVVSAGEHVLTTIGRWLGGTPTTADGEATSLDVSGDPAAPGSASGAAASLDGAAEGAEDGPAPTTATMSAARSAGGEGDPRAGVSLASPGAAETTASSTQGGIPAGAISDAADAAGNLSNPPAATTVAAVPASAPSSDGPTISGVTTAAPVSVEAAPAPLPADTGSLAGRIMSRVLDALDVLENAPPPRRMTVDIGDTSGTRLQVALRGSEVHVSVLGGGPEPQLAGWGKDLSTALEARGFSLGNSDAGHGQRRGQDGTAPDEQLPAAPGTPGTAANTATGAPATPDTGLRL